MSAGLPQRQWSGEWVADRLGVVITTTDAPIGVGLQELVGLAVRRNPRRAHLLVSRVLGKHVPTAPALVYGSGLLLGAMVGVRLGAELPADALPRLGALLRATLGTPADGAASDAQSDAAAADLLAQAQALAGTALPCVPVVLGYAETATGLGHAVADALDARYLHSTRRPVPGVAAVGGFEEEHSHATSHLLLPADPSLLEGPAPLVLVDDELSTGTTALNTIRALHRAYPRERYVIAALVDLRSQTDRARMGSVAAELSVRIDVVALAAGQVALPDEVLARGAALVATVQAGAAPVPPARAGSVRRLELDWPTTLPDGGRHGFEPAHRAQLEDVLPLLGKELASRLGNAGRVLVLGTEELMYAPLRLALALAENTDATVRYSTTTRSPVLPVDDAGYAIRTRLTFPAHDDTANGDSADGPGARFAYNVAPPAGDGAAEQSGYDSVLLVVDDTADTPELGGLLGRLSAVCDDVALVVLPSHRPAARALPEPLYGPDFGSYRRDEVAWLLTDLSDVALEAPTEEREEAMQNGGAHYAESLPVEYQPSAEYQQLFAEALEASAERVAYAVGVITERTLATRGPSAVLVSLARAGTPIGVLMRRWALHVHGLELPHYAVSIVRGKGIDSVALQYLAAHHDPADVMFVDGWTGKGAITRELVAALDRHADLTGARFRTQLAVLADPGRCVELSGTHEDYLIPSACLNSTVSGLVSRTVLNETHLAPGQFHGAKFYAELAGVDMSNHFLDAVSARFDDVRAAVAARAADPPAVPTWEGWRAVERISERYGIGDVNLVKPGVGETTRVMLRRVPWKVLVSDAESADLRHIRLLAAQRGVPVEVVRDLPFRCVGLIHPKFTRGATGADGVAAHGPAYVRGTVSP